MNEQMKSKLHKLADACKHPDNYHQGPWMDYIQFAELIVRECAVIVGSMEEPHQDIAKLVKEHFGVEE
jgi:hypothetical protein